MTEKSDGRSIQIAKLVAATSVLAASLGMIQPATAANEGSQTGTAQSLKGESLQDKHTQFLKTESLQGKHHTQLKYDSEQHKTSTQIKNGSEAVQLNPQPEPPKPTTTGTPH